MLDTSDTINNMSEQSFSSWHATDQWGKGAYQVTICLYRVIGAITENYAKDDKKVFLWEDPRSSKRKRSLNWVWKYGLTSAQGIQGVGPSHSATVLLSLSSLILIGWIEDKGIFKEKWVRQLEKRINNNRNIFKFLKKIIVLWLLSSVVLISAVQQSESALCMCISPLFWIFFPFRSPESTE